MTNSSFHLVISITLFVFLVLSNSVSYGEEGLTSLVSYYQGTFGIYALDTNTGESIEYNATKKFPICSTAKLMIVAAVLKQSMVEEDVLNQHINFTKAQVDASGYAPITKKHLSSGMTIRQLCAAAIEYSDNTAANLLIKNLGGSAAITQFARSINDENFRLDRYEPDLNSAIPGDERDTSTPKAMSISLANLVFKGGLAPMQSNLLLSWLINSKTGGNRIRSAVPKGWIVGDKTGTGDYGTTNDVAILWPPHCKPIVMTIYFTQPDKNAKPDDQAIASAARFLISIFAKNDVCFSDS